MDSASSWTAKHLPNMDIPKPFGNAFAGSWTDQHPLLGLAFVLWPIALGPAVFTWVLPGLLRYQRGQMAWIAAALSLILTLLLPLQLWWEPLAVWYGRLHVALYVVFYVFAAAGLALCRVGIYDRKRSAWWALASVATMVCGALHDTAVWFGLFSSSPAVPLTFAVGLGLLVVGFIRAPSDPPASIDMREASRLLANNRTRRSRSISRKLLREGSIHWLPVYWLLMQSDLAREGIINSGSYRFADHIYKNIPSGRGPFGRWIDGRFLALPATQAFFRRYKRCQQELMVTLAAAPPEEAFRMLAIPCGIPRDIAEFCDTFQGDPASLQRITYYGMDLDPELLDLAAAWLKPLPLARYELLRGNALVAEDFPDVKFDFIVSTGLGEFLGAAEIEVFYANVYGALNPGGVFYTSATRYESRSESFLRTFELLTQYRTIDHLDEILGKLPWKNLKLVQDESGLQTYVRATK